MALGRATLSLAHCLLLQLRPSSPNPKESLQNCRVWRRLEARPAGERGLLVPADGRDQCPVEAAHREGGVPGAPHTCIQEMVTGPCPGLEGGSPAAQEKAQGRHHTLLFPRCPGLVGTGVSRQEMGASANSPCLMSSLLPPGCQLLTTQHCRSSHYLSAWPRLGTQ